MIKNVGTQLMKSHHQMNQKNHSSDNIPELRFPEFVNDEEWAEKRLGDVTYPVSERNKDGDKYPIYSISNLSGFIPQSEQFEGVDGHTRGYEISIYKLIKKNTFAKMSNDA